MSQEFKSPLYGHSSEESAYLIADYPYGRLRCQMRVWLEHDPKKGFRFCSRTEDPKKPGKWNAIKKSTYMLIAGNMYIDENGHVKWSGISEYSEAKDILAFVQTFPESELSELSMLVGGRISMYRKMAEGTAYMGMTINGVRKDPTPEELQASRDRAQVQLQEYLKIKEALLARM